MNNALLLTRRNLRSFFRDRMNVFFSLLSALILFSLYALFLGNQAVSGLETQFPHAASGDIHGFVNAWVFAGITMITTLTTGFSALSVFVQDSSTGRFKDFLVSPIKRWQLTLSYLLSSYVIAIIMTTIVLAVGQIYLKISGYTVMSPSELAHCYLYILVVAAGFSAISSLVVTFIKSAGAFSSFSTILGTILGFVAGAYIPFGSMSSGVVNILNSLPFAQAALLIRQPFTAHYLHALTAGNPEAATHLKSYYAISGSVGNFTLTNGFILLVFVVIIGVFMFLGVMRMNKKID